MKRVVGGWGCRGGMDMVCMCANFVACSCCDGQMCVCILCMVAVVVGVVSVDLRRTRQFLSFPASLVYLWRTVISMGFNFSGKPFLP